MKCSEITTLTTDPALVLQIQNDILQEIYRAAKFPNIKTLRGALSPFFQKSTRRFSELIAGIDHLIKEKGFVYASYEALCQLSEQPESFGRENIPVRGPVIIASNHPGTVDGFSIISQLPRDDIKILVSGVPFFNNLPNAGQRLIYTSADPILRAEAIRKSVRHLENGGSLLIFPAGRLEPDPSLLPGAGESLHHWSRSIEVFMRKVPRSKLVLTITSGVLSPEFVNHPFTRLFRNDHERRRIMEFMQMIKQMIRGKPLALTPRVSFGIPLTYDLVQNKEKDFIALEANELLNQHLERFY